MSLAAMTRRSLLGALAGLPLAGCVRSALRGEAGLSSPSLDALARKGGRRFGSAVAWNPGGTRMSVTNPRYAELLRAECGVIVPENEMKWQALRPSPDRFDFRAMDEIADWAAANTMQLRAHVLLWHRPEWLPQWLNT